MVAYKVGIQQGLPVAKELGERLPVRRFGKEPQSVGSRPVVERVAVGQAVAAGLLLPVPDCCQ